MVRSTRENKFDNRIGKTKKRFNCRRGGKQSTKARERETVETTTIQGSKTMIRTVVPAGAGDERSAERFREEKSPTLLAGRRRTHFFAAFVPLEIRALC